MSEPHAPANGPFLDRVTRRRPLLRGQALRVGGDLARPPGHVRALHRLGIHLAGECDTILPAPVLHRGPLVAAEIPCVDDVRRFDIHRWALDRERGFWFGNADKIPNGSGEMKAFAFSEPTMVVSKAIAWCVGDPEAVSALLHSEIHSLGRRAGSGWGWLRDDGASTTVEVVDDPEEALRWRRRSLPLSLEADRLPGHHRAMVTVRAPYWQRSQRHEALEYAGDPLG